MMLDIDREWHQLPGWSLGLSTGEQATLIGYRRTRASSGPAKGTGAPGSRRG